MGRDSVISVDVDKSGRMVPSALERAIQECKHKGMTPLYVNATSGTTVMGSFDPLDDIAEVCHRHNLWLHVDASWGGPVVFSAKHRHKMVGSARADSVTINPHKMLNVPVTCSFLLGPDMAVFHRANTLAAGYLFHGPDDEDSDPVVSLAEADTKDHNSFNEWDLADLTLQCGRRGDSLKLALSWTYYGSRGFETRIDDAFELAAYFAARVNEHAEFVLVSESPPPCLQVCFYYAPQGRLAQDAARNSKQTRGMVAALIKRGFMVDHAPGEQGNFFRVVVNLQTKKTTVDGLLSALEAIGAEAAVAER